MKRFISFLICLIFIFTFSINCFAIGDPISAAMIGAAAYSVAADFGITFAGLTQAHAESWMNDNVNLYLDGRDLISVFGDELVLSGQMLILGQKTFNAIKAFLNQLSGMYGLGDTQKTFAYYFGDTYVTLDSDIPSEWGIYLQAPVNQNGSYVISWYKDNSKIQDWGGVGRFSTNSTTAPALEIRIYNSYAVIGRARGNKLSDGSPIYQENVLQLRYAGITNTGTPVTGINPGELGSQPDIGPTSEWRGTIDGLAPDTNLDQLMGEISSSVADTSLSVDGEITDVAPVPTPVPTIAPDIPLQDVPWEGLNDLIDATGQDITDSIGEAAQDITGALEGLNDTTAEGVQDIVESIEGVQEGVQGLTDTISEALTAPEIDEKTFDLRELFPFCIPFDIYHLLQKFDGSPAAPHVQLPIVIPSLGFSYTLDLDFSAWDPVAAAMRTVELIVYSIGLAWATSKVIKW